MAATAPLHAKPVHTAQGKAELAHDGLHNLVFAAKAQVVLDAVAEARAKPSHHVQPGGQMLERPGLSSGSHKGACLHCLQHTKNVVHLVVK